MNTSPIFPLLEAFGLLKPAPVEASDGTWWPNAGLALLHDLIERRFAQLEAQLNPDTSYRRIHGREVVQ